MILESLIWQPSFGSIERTGITLVSQDAMLLTERGVIVKVFKIDKIPTESEKFFFSKKLEIQKGHESLQIYSGQPMGGIRSQPYCYSNHSQVKNALR